MNDQGHQMALIEETYFEAIATFVAFEDDGTQIDHG